MRELSIFVDESGTQEATSEYYLVTLVFHDQRVALARYFDAYRESLRLRNLPDIPFHATPLMRANDDYSGIDPGIRHRLMVSFAAFVRDLPVRYKLFAYRCRSIGGPQQLMTTLKRGIVNFIFDHLDYFQGFDRVKIYYDGGQAVVTKALHGAFEYALSSNVIVYKATDFHSYRLAQVADYLCMIELTALKYAGFELTSTDKRFFGSSRDFKKNYLKKARAKLL